MSGAGAEGTQSDRVLNELLGESTTELFAAYGHHLAPLPFKNTDGVEMALCGIIGFSGADVRGTLLIALDAELLVNMTAAMVSPRDWLSELANQLLGRLKNKLLRHGATIYSSTPLVIRGEYMQPVGRNGLPDPTVLGAGKHRAFVWIDYEMRPDLSLVPSDGAHADQPNEGDALMFE